MNPLENLSTEQQTALQKGEPVYCKFDETECIVVRNDVFDRLNRISVDFGEWSEDEMRTVTGRTLEDLDDAKAIP